MTEHNDAWYASQLKIELQGLLAVVDAMTPEEVIKLREILRTGNHWFSELAWKQTLEENFPQGVRWEWAKRRRHEHDC